jgi:hypothetical protein
LSGWPIISAQAGLFPGCHIHDAQEACKTSRPTSDIDGDRQQQPTGHGPARPGHPAQPNIERQYKVLIGSPLRQWDGPLEPGHDDAGMMPVNDCPNNEQQPSSKNKEKPPPFARRGLRGRKDRIDQTE